MCLFEQGDLRGDLQNNNRLNSPRVQCGGFLEALQKVLTLEAWPQMGCVVGGQRSRRTPGRLFWPWERKPTSLPGACCDKATREVLLCNCGCIGSSRLSHNAQTVSGGWGGSPTPSGECLARFALLGHHNNVTKTICLKMPGKLQREVE